MDVSESINLLDIGELLLSSAIETLLLIIICDFSYAKVTVIQMKIVQMGSSAFKENVTKQFSLVTEELMIIP